SERFGPGALRAFLVGFGEGAEFAELVPRVLRVTVAALDEAFREHLRTKLARFEGQFVYAPWSLPPADEAAKVAAASPGDASLAGRHAASLLAEGKQGEARRVAERAIALDAHEPYARFVLARLSVADRPAAAETHLEALLARVDGVEPRLMLATILLRADHLDEAEAQLRRAAELDRPPPTPDRTRPARATCPARAPRGAPPPWAPAPAARRAPGPPARPPAPDALARAPARPGPPAPAAPTKAGPRACRILPWSR